MDYRLFGHKNRFEPAKIGIIFSKINSISKKINFRKYPAYSFPLIKLSNPTHIKDKKALAGRADIKEIGLSCLFVGSYVAVTLALNLVKNYLPDSH